MCCCFFVVSVVCLFVCVCVCDCVASFNVLLLVVRCIAALLLCWVDVFFGAVLWLCCVAVSLCRCLVVLLMCV